MKYLSATSLKSRRSYYSKYIKFKKVFKQVKQCKNYKTGKIACEIFEANNLKYKILNGVKCNNLSESVVGKILININNENEGICSGTLIAPNVFLSAAHCFDDGDKIKSVKVSFAGKKYNATKWYVNPAYNGDSEKGDISLIYIKEVASYSPDYMSGFCSEIYTIDLKDAHNDAMHKMSRDIHYMAERDVLMRYDRVRSVRLNTSYYDETYKHIFIPVYSTAYTYKGNHYNVLINGETGKIKGEYPKSPVKIAAIIIVIIGILFGIYLASSNNEDISYNDEIENTQQSELIDYKTFVSYFEEEMF